MNLITKKILKEIYFYKNKNKAKVLSSFFKTNKGEYGEGDLFLGLTAFITKKIALKYNFLSKEEILFLLKNKFHEVRLIGVRILIEKYKQSTTLKEKEIIINFYLKNTKYINNWDLVDLSAYSILGNFLYNFSSKSKAKKILIELANSKNLWKQRIAIVATFAFTRKGEIEWTFKIAKIFFEHEHDLIHKATGWMLREAGKKDIKKLQKFLNIYISKMPRTMFRYAIEKFPEKLRKEYLLKK